VLLLVLLVLLLVALVVLHLLAPLGLALLTGGGGGGGGGGGRLGRGGAVGAGLHGRVLVPAGCERSVVVVSGWVGLLKGCARSITDAVRSAAAHGTLPRAPLTDPNPPGSALP